jgi:pimeloyl-ACP methyl ester carboxylesterase
MTKFLIFVSGFLCSIMGSVVVNAQEPRAGQIVIEPYIFRTYDGREHPAELGRLWVRENRNGNSGRLIQLAFVRLRSTAAQPSAPIVFLAGGPGIPGVGLGQVPVYFSLFERLREVSDVILLDQRGTGMSSPNLQCPPVTFPPDTFEKTENWLRAYSGFVQVCADHWRAEGVDLASYNSNASADDLEDLRRALAVERLSLLAWSYGTELALATVRRHGKRLDRVVLASTRGPDNLLKLPSVWDSQIRRLSRLAAEDSNVGRIVSDMDSLMRRVMERLERNPVPITVTDRRTNRQVSLRVGKIGLQTLVRGDLSDTRAFAVLPALLYTMDHEDYSILTRRMEQLYNGFGGSAMGLATDCAAGWSAARLARANREAQAALMSNVNLQWRPDICALTGAADLGANFRARIRSNVPTLFVSGTLDPNAPPAQAEEVRRGFSKGVHLIVENAGHESLPAAEVQSVIVDFFKRQDVSRRTISLPRPRFISVEEAKSPPPSRR